MKESPAALLDRWSPQELRRRALILSALSEANNVVAFPQGGTAASPELIRWESWGGDDASWLFYPDGRVLLLVFDHEGELNLYSDWEVATQESLYEGVPEDMVAPLRDLPDMEPFLMLGDDSGALPVASGVFWFDGERWRPSQGLVKLVANRGLDLASDSGFDHCMSWFDLKNEFTLESFWPEADGHFDITFEQLAELFASVDSD